MNNNYPNPFSEYTTIEFEVKRKTATISLLIYDSKGNLIKQLIQNKVYHKGCYKVNWLGDNSTDDKVNKGIYFYKLISDNIMVVKKAIVVK